MIPLLLTATINPQGMANAAFSVTERAQQYIESIQFYLSALPQSQIVFAENSGCIGSIRPHFDNTDRIEWLDASTLSAPLEYDQRRGKGYNEWLLMHHAVSHSSAIQSASCFFKITGRLKILNIARLISECQQRDENLRFLADCKDHEVYEKLHIKVNGHAGECRYFFSSVDFFELTIFPNYGQLCDESVLLNSGVLLPAYLAEDLMLEICRQARHLPHCYDRFHIQARISGKGGHDLGKGSRFFHSTDNDSMILRFKSSLRQLLRWLLPWWRC